jgi:hypothetical protein
MLALYLRAFCQILRFEYYIVGGDFSALYRRVTELTPCAVLTTPHSIHLICRTVDLICVWYPKQVLCLQRSAATACLLKRYGFPARLIIGVQQIPFRAHSWVEVQGRVVNDRPYMREDYMVLECC